jgi:glycosyltransferase involved in cell wall biosynthesis
MKVSVLVMTYNHERFVAQALDSALMQDVAFDWEILVSEDCSTDRTREIVVEYARRHPDRIRLLLSERNVRSNYVVRRGIEAARGTYIALLDGDDYWTSPHKLRLQAEFLDRRPDCAISFHNALVVHEDGTREPHPWTPAGHPETTTLDDLWAGNYIATASTMFRRGLVDPIPEWYDALFPITDWPLHVLNAEHGDVGYIDEVMSVYRYHEGGLYSPLSERRKQESTVELYHAMNRNLGGRYEGQITRALLTYLVEWAEEYERRGDVRRARECFAACLAQRPAHMRRRLLRMAWRLYGPARARRADALAG